MNDVETTIGLPERGFLVDHSERAFTAANLDGDIRRKYEVRVRLRSLLGATIFSWFVRIVFRGTLLALSN